MTVVIGCMSTPYPVSLPDSSPVSYDVIYTYRTPDDLTEAIQTIRDYLEYQDGYFSGNERRGERIRNFPLKRWSTLNISSVSAKLQVREGGASKYEKLME